MIRAARLSVHVLTALVMIVLVSACNPNKPSVAELTLTAEPASFPAEGGDILLAATVLTAGGSPLPNVEVTFTASGGTLSADKAATDAEGIARVRLAATQPVTVKARAQSAEAELAVRLQTAVQLTLSSPEPRRNEVITIRVALRSAGQAGSGQVNLSFGNGDSVDLGQVNGEATTTYKWSEEGEYNVTATLREGSEESKTTIRVAVRGFGPLDDHIDASQVIWLSPATTNVSNWAITSQVNGISISGSTVCIDHTKAGRWPLVSIDNNPPNIEGNILIVVNINGQWYGGGYDWMGAGRICKSVDPSEFGRDQIRVHPLDASWHGPRSGETVGLLITTPSSNRIPVRSVNERTPITLVTWP